MAFTLVPETLSANNENEGALDWYTATIENPQLYTVDYRYLHVPIELLNLKVNCILTMCEK